MRAVVIGSSGHAGSYTVPALVQAGYEVVSITRGTRKPYTSALKEWDEVRTVEADRRALEKDGTFGSFVMDFKPDVICDLICYEKSQAEQLAAAAIGRVSSYVFIGTVWVYDYNIEVPATESHPRNALGKYGRGKIDIEEYLLDLWNEKKLPCTILHIGHLVGKGWSPINPQGNFNKSVYEEIAAGRELLLPDRGSSTVHHVHSADVAQMVVACLEKPGIAAGQVYHTTSRNAVTLRGYAETLYAKFNREPNITYVSLQELMDTLKGEDVIKTFEHVSHSPCVSIEKAQRELSYNPLYSSMQAVSEALDNMIETGEIKIH